jgi:Isochorismatase family
MVLNPSSSALVVIDSVVRNLPSDAIEVTRSKQLLAAAALLPIPIFIVGCPTGDASANNAGSPYSAAAARYDFEATVTDLSTTALGRAIAATGRLQLVICGHWLEEAVTLASLRAISVGYDTYLPIDAVVAYDALLESVVHTRLAHAGIVLTSAAQVVREWAALSGSKSVSDGLLQLLR